MGIENTLARMLRSGDSGDAIAGASINLEGGALFNGATYAPLRGPGVFISLNAVAIGAEATLWTPTAGKKFRLMGGLVSIGTAAGNVLLKDNTGGSTILIIPKAALDSPIALPPIGNGILSAAINNPLRAVGVATATISGFLFGTEE